MTSKLVIVDIDDVIASRDARFAKAEEAKQAFLDAQGVTRDLPAVEKQAVDIYWQTAFTPELIHLDTLLPGVIPALALFHERGYDLLYLTSRPELMRQVTVNWFWDHGMMDYERLAPYNPLIMKPTAFKYTRTMTWKAGTVQMLVSLYRPNDLIVVDDRQENIDELLKYAPFPGVEMLNCYASLAEAVADIK